MDSRFTPLRFRGLKKGLGVRFKGRFGDPVLRWITGLQLRPRDCGSFQHSLVFSGILELCFSYVVKAILGKLAS